MLSRESRKGEGKCHLVGVSLVAAETGRILDVLRTQLEWQAGEGWQREFSEWGTDGRDSISA